MTAPPLVSVLTPSLNQGRYLRDAIESVLRQTYGSIEHIIADGGSSDETISVVRAYEGRVQFESEPDSGPADAVNKAFARSRGEIVGWLNADDFYVSRDAIGAAVEALSRPGAPDVAYGHAVFVDEANRVLKVWLRPAFAAERLRRFDFISQPATFFRRSAAPSPLLDPELQYAFDYDLWLRLLDRDCRFQLLDEIVAAMRYHPAAKSVSDRPELWRESDGIRPLDAKASDPPLVIARDLGVMLGLKLMGLARFGGRGLARARWCVPLSLPSVLMRPLYQFGLVGSPGSGLLLPRYLILGSRRRSTGGRRA